LTPIGFVFREGNGAHGLVLVVIFLRGLNALAIFTNPRTARYTIISLGRESAHMRKSQKLGGHNGIFLGKCEMAGSAYQAWQGYQGNLTEGFWGIFMHAY
jgi:hypothetical protein